MMLLVGIRPLPGLDSSGAPRLRCAKISVGVFPTCVRHLLNVRRVRRTAFNKSGSSTPIRCIAVRRARCRKFLEFYLARYLCLQPCSSEHRATAGGRTSCPSCSYALCASWTGYVNHLPPGPRPHGDTGPAKTCLGACQSAVMAGLSRPTGCSAAKCLAARATRRTRHNGDMQMLTASPWMQAVCLAFALRAGAEPETFQLSGSAVSRRVVGK